MCAADDASRIRQLEEQVMALERELRQRKSAKASFKPDPAKFAGTVRHVIYEVERFLEMDRRVFLATPPIRDAMTRDACIESLIVHARILDDFFSNSPERRNGRDDDVSCVDFGFALRHGLDDGAKMRMNKYVQHLSYGRVHEEPGDNSWKHADFAPILASAEAFLDHLVINMPAGVREEDVRRLDEVRALAVRVRSWMMTAPPTMMVEARTDAPMTPLGFSLGE